MPVLPDGGLKRLLQRSWFWVFWFIIGTIVDEWVKEGYLFKPPEIWSPEVTHEKIVICMILLLVSLLLKNRIRHKP